MQDKDLKKIYEKVRQPAVAGQFYPAEPQELKKEISGYLNDVRTDVRRDVRTRAIIVPHAGYVFSAPVAAYAYKELEGSVIGTAVIICNSHTAHFSGVAADESDAWETPLGLVEVDREMAEKLAESGVVKIDGAVHESDHTLEVQVPFLQTVLKGDFKILPLFFGNTYGDDYKKLAQALAENLSDDDLIVISTDLSHYPKYEDAQIIDNKTLEMIAGGDIEKLEKHISEVEASGVENEQTVCCGIDGVKTIMEMARLKDWGKAEILKYANSGDSAYGDKEQVVGYGSMAYSSDESKVSPHSAEASRGKSDEFESDDNVLNREQKEELLKIAKDTVEAFVSTGQAPDFKISDERLNWKEGAFVTLHKNGDLRGCIGQIVPSDKPLWEVVRDMAVAACSEDYRFDPVSEKELGKIDYEISVLSVPESIDDWEKIELGKHGVIVKKGFKTGVFLPQVADETGWSLEQFLSQLCWQKAGLPPTCYKDDKDVELLVYTAQVF